MLSFQTWIVSKCLSKKAEDRYQNATDLLVDLRNVDFSGKATSRNSADSHRSSVQTKPIEKQKYIFAALVVAALIVGFLARGFLSQSPQDTPDFSQLIVPAPDFRPAA